MPRQYPKPRQTREYTDSRGRTRKTPVFQELDSPRSVRSNVRMRKRLLNTYGFTEDEADNIISFPVHLGTSGFHKAFVRRRSQVEDAMELYSTSFVNAVYIVSLENEVTSIYDLLSET